MIVDAGRGGRTVGAVTLASRVAAKILVVDDDDATRESIVVALRRDGFLCTEAADANRARYVIRTHRPDLVVLDLGLPDGDGADLLVELRRTDDLPVIVCSGRDTEPDRVSGFDLGADDYVTKPFSAKELAMRIRSVLRRSASRPPSSDVVSFGTVRVDVAAHEVTVAGQPVALTSREFSLLVFLARNPRIAFTRADLLRNVWQSAPDSRSEATVTEHVRRLRRKIGDDNENPRHLCAVRGVGYRLVP